MRKRLTNQDNRTRLDEELKPRFSLYMNPEIKQKVIDIIHARTRVYRIDDYEDGGFIERPSTSNLFNEGVK